ncbi:hypothetical protein A1O7_09555 [Cladophialophora yegresii CBS 114405]|uniref:Uncharacterized protein n=1 Tax=Cladophialophora yegresii CBS 114405 TaxID=1182544 RepID=W9VFF4_9EURO|nr:uncharacterized protein A1O7_09555 [Cladophialophora yegresii CBS 114405]EXJ54218.1 hypothetical protein A1O7_09555 [Cladophialophora yegresii CBS 114405]
MDFVRTTRRLRKLFADANHYSSAGPQHPERPGLQESEYILMEEADGTPLHEVRDGQMIHDKLKIVDDVVAFEKKLLSISFTRYGNLYYATDAFPGCEKAELAGDALQSQKDEIERRFVIGPVIDAPFWNYGRGGMEIDRGPCEDTSSEN